MVAILYPDRRTVDANNVSKVFFAVGKIGDEGIWMASPAELDERGFVNQYGLSRKVHTFV